jgi:hypothetical protein
VGPVEIDGDLTVKGTTTVKDISIAGAESGGGPRDDAHGKRVRILYLGTFCGHPTPPAAIAAMAIVTT